MKKSLIALAVAGTFAAPAAFAATANVDIYGVIKMSYDRIKTDSSVDDGTHTRVSSNSSRIGFKGSEDLGGGLKALWQWETGLAADTNGATATNRNTFIGLNGGFGTVLAGTHDTPYKLSTGRFDVFGDTQADYNGIIGNVGGAVSANSVTAANPTGATTNRLDLRTSNTIAYISPTMSGFSVAAAWVAFNETGTKAAKDPSAYSLSASYVNGPLALAVAHERHRNVWDDSETVKGTKLGAGYTFGDTKLGLVYEDISDSLSNSAADRSAWYASVAHAMGPITLKAAYGRAGDGDSAAKTGARVYSLGADYALSKRTKAYALYSKVSNDSGARYQIGGAGGGGTYTPQAGNDPSVISIGMEHSF